MQRLSLGLDSSTQKLQAIVIDIDTGEKVFDRTLNYRIDPRLKEFGLNNDYILSPRNHGEADQPAKIYFASLDAMFEDIPPNIRKNIVVINASGQQHGHVYLNEIARSFFDNVRTQKPDSDKNLASLLGLSLADDRAPIWMTSNTEVESAEIREYTGGKQTMIELSGSDSPLRFTGAIIRNRAKRDFQRVSDTWRIQLIGNLIPAVLTGNPDVPADFANACGMSLMDYRERQWSSKLIDAVSTGLSPSFRATELSDKLPKLVPPDSIVGVIARYFVEKYGFDAGCKVVAGSGDNPQSKVLVSGDLLSLGTSFVIMTSSCVDSRDMSGCANSMYDGIGRPFIFGCRTNGAMVWDKVRMEIHGLSKTDYETGEDTLRVTKVGGERMFFWQPKMESFPVSGIIPLTRVGYYNPYLSWDYNGVIETSLASVFINSQGFARQTREPLYVTGAATESPEIMRRVAAIWNRRVIPIEKGGASLGAAVAGAYSYSKSEPGFLGIEALNRAVLARGSPIEPRPDDVAAYHGEKGYLSRFRETEARLIKEHP